MWEHCFDGNIVARVRIPEDEPPYVGMPVIIVGRTSKPAPAENFIVTGIDNAGKRLYLGESRSSP